VADRFAFIVTVNKGLKPPNYWALLLASVTGRHLSRVISSG
jgi:hypothetical protein